MSSDDNGILKVKRPIQGETHFLADSEEARTLDAGIVQSATASGLPLRIVAVRHDALGGWHVTVEVDVEVTVLTPAEARS